MSKIKLIIIMGVLFFIGYVTTFNCGGCGGGGGGSSGSSIPIGPSVTTKPATNITQTTATLNGTVNPNGVAVSASFQFGTSVAYGSNTAPQSITSGIPQGGITVTATITGLSPNTLYNFRIRATTGSGGTGIVFNGTNQTFTTGGLPPTCATNPATNINSNSARLNGTVNPNGFDTNAYFNYGLTTSYDSLPAGQTGSTTSQAIGSGAISLAVSATVSSLTPSSLYNFRVVGVNPNGTTNGNNLTFTTGAPYGSAPTCTTDPADNITYNSATLNGTVIPNGVATTIYFNYGLTTSYTVTTTAQAIGNGITSVVVTANISGLSANILYNFRVVGASSAGTTYGNNLTFTTTPPPPAQVGSPNPTNGATSIPTNQQLSWGAASGATSYNVYCGTDNPPSNIINGTNTVSTSYALSSLLYATTYYWRIDSTNASGTTTGAVWSFTTAAPPPPTCTTNPATNITSTSATLNGTVNPNSSNTTAYFQWGTTTSYGNITTSQPIGIGTTNVPVNADISGLSASTLYNFRVAGTNSSGTTYGNNLTFTTAAPPPPSSTTDAATNVTYNSATLNGTVNPNGLSTNAYFQWGVTTSYSSSTTAQAIGSGTSNVAVLADISGLSANTLYNFRVVGTNSSGTTYGDNLTFTTGNLPGSAPTVTTNSATNVTSNSATLNGEVNPNWLLTTADFEWGQIGQTPPPALYSFFTTSQNIGSGTSNVNVTADINGLLAERQCDFRLAATNSAGTTYGANQTFTTTAATAVDDYCWVSSNTANNVTRITKSTSATTTIAVANSPQGIAVDATYCWVTRYNAANVTRITKSTLDTTNIAVGSNPYTVAVDATYCWVANGTSNNVTRITKSTLATTNIAVETSPRGVAVDATYCWVSNYTSGTVNCILKSTGAVYATIAVGTNPLGVAVDETYCWVAIYTNPGTVTRITKTDLNVTTIAVGINPRAVAVDETYCWVVNQGSGTVTRIQKSNSATTAITVGTAPWGVAVDATYCWVSNYVSNNVTRITKAGLGTTNIAVGNGPYSSGDMTGYAYDNYSRVP